MKPITLRDGVPFCGDREIKIGDVLYTSGEIVKIDAGDTTGRRTRAGSGAIATGASSRTG